MIETIVTRAVRWAPLLCLAGTAYVSATTVNLWLNHPLRPLWSASADAEPLAPSPAAPTRAFLDRNLFDAARTEENRPAGRVEPDPAPAGDPARRRLALGPCRPWKGPERLVGTWVGAGETRPDWAHVVEPARDRAYVVRVGDALAGGRVLAVWPLAIYVERAGRCERLGRGRRTP